MHLILTGATGLVGSGVLDAMLAMPEITRISVLSRRPVPMLEARIQAQDPAVRADRVRVILHRDFAVYDDALLQQLRGASGIVWALGISQTQVDKDEYVKITKDYALAAAQAFQDRLPSPEPKAKKPASSSSGSDALAQDNTFRFVYVSGEGAATHPGVFTQRFGRVKGETEVALAALASKTADANDDDKHIRFQAVSVRPAAVDPAAHTAILPYLPVAPLTLRVLRAALAPPLRVVYPSIMSPTRPLGQFLAQVAMGRFDGRLTGPGIETVGQTPILSNVAFRRLAGL